LVAGILLPEPRVIRTCPITGIIDVSGVHKTLKGKCEIAHINCHPNGLRSVPINRLEAKMDRPDWYIFPACLAFVGTVAVIALIVMGAW
jgi:hypothetical protein